MRIVVAEGRGFHPQWGVVFSHSLARILGVFVGASVSRSSIFFNPPTRSTSSYPPRARPTSMPCLMRTSDDSSSASRVRDNAWNNVKVLPLALASAFAARRSSPAVEAFISPSRLGTKTASPSSLSNTHPSSAALFNSTDTRLRNAGGVSGRNTAARNPVSIAVLSFKSDWVDAFHNFTPGNTEGVFVSTKRSAISRCELPSVVYICLSFCFSEEDKRSPRFATGGVVDLWSVQKASHRRNASLPNNSKTGVRTTTGVSCSVSNPLVAMLAAIACACSKLTPVCSRFVPSGITSAQFTSCTRG
mmetsp:Transcript_4786/g.17663  ORF Transcript_4786/g.17663 Transcript_4786/m.17663 type:complete len:303 (-) Transcript_4786:185-1093(-)